MVLEQEGKQEEGDKKIGAIGENGEKKRRKRAKTHINTWSLS